jgi:hypothetical protein
MAHRDRTDPPEFRSASGSVADVIERGRLCNRSRKTPTRTLPVPFARCSNMRKVVQMPRRQHVALQRSRIHGEYAQTYPSALPYSLIA